MGLCATLITNRIACRVRSHGSMDSPSMPRLATLNAGARHDRELFMGRAKSASGKLYETPKQTASVCLSAAKVPQCDAFSMLTISNPSIQAGQQLADPMLLSRTAVGRLRIFAIYPAELFHKSNQIISYQLASAMCAAPRLSAGRIKPGSCVREWKCRYQ